LTAQTNALFFVAQPSARSSWQPVAKRITEFERFYDLRSIFEIEEFISLSSLGGVFTVASNGWARLLKKTK
jgi:hypothetical protein